MGILGGNRPRRGQSASGRWVMVPRDVTAPPRRRARVLQRRRRIFTRLLALALITLGVGVAPDLRWVWFVNLGADATLGLYVWRLLRWKRQDADEQLDLPQVEPIPAAPPAIQTYRLDPEPAIAPAPEPAVVADQAAAARLIEQTG